MRHRAVMDNADLADALDRIAELLAVQKASAFRVRAYSAAAFELRAMSEPAGVILDREGLPGLERLPHIGPSIARTIAEAVHSGRLRILERLEGELGQEPAVPIRQPSSQPAPQPSVAQLLAIDALYRELAAKGALSKIAPRRFNPERRAWLPVMHEELDGYEFTALFSNTARAHALGTTHDWVVITYEDAHGEGQATVVTERRGVLAGLRVVRGREAECRRFHARSYAQALRQLRMKNRSPRDEAGLHPEPRVCRELT